MGPEMNATWIDWGPYLDGQLTYRMVYRGNEYARRIAFALNGGYVPAGMEGYVPRSAPCSTERFEQAGWQGCFSDAGLAVSCKLQAASYKQRQTPGTCWSGCLLQLVA